MNAKKNIIDLTDDIWLLDNGAAVNIPGDISTARNNSKEERLIISRQFRCPVDTDLGCARLVMEQVDCIADIVINGETVKSVDNLFVRWVVPVGKYLIPGKNTIDILFFPIEESSEKSRGARTMSGNNSDFGIYGNFYIDLSELFIEGVRTEIIKDRDEWVINLDVGINSFSDRYISADRCHVKLLRKSYGFPEKGVFLRRGSNSLKFSLRIPETSVKTWNPIGCGEPHLYSLLVCVESALPFSAKIGFREIRLPIKSGEPLLINNKEIRIKGVAVLPESLSGGSCHEILSLLNAERLLDFGFNAVLISRFGKYDNDFFYEVFDEVGLLVFHEFMVDGLEEFSSKRMIDRLLEEVEYQTCRLSTHPSLIFWMLPDSGCEAAGASILSFLRKNERTRFIDRDTADLIFRKIEFFPSWSSYETLYLCRQIDNSKGEARARKTIALSHLIQAEDFLEKYDGKSYMLYYLNETAAGYNRSLSDFYAVNKPVAERIRSLNFNSHTILQEIQEPEKNVLSFGMVQMSGEPEEMMRVRLSVRDFNGNELINYTLILKDKEWKEDRILSELIDRIEVPWFVLASSNTSADVLVPQKFRSIVPESGIRINSARMDGDGVVILELENDRPAFSVLLYSSFPGEFETNLFDMPERKMYVRFRIDMDILFSLGIGCEKLLNPDLLMSAFSVWDSFSVRH